MGVFKFSTTAKNIISLTDDIPSIERKVDGMLDFIITLFFLIFFNEEMIQFGGECNLLAGIAIAREEFQYTRYLTLFYCAMY